MTKIYIDENFASQIAEGLNIFQQHLNLKEKHKFEVNSILKTFGPGKTDEDGFPYLEKRRLL